MTNNIIWMLVLVWVSILRAKRLGISPLVLDWTLLEFVSYVRFGPCLFLYVDMHGHLCYTERERERERFYPLQTKYRLALKLNITGKRILYRIRFKAMKWVSSNGIKLECKLFRFNLHAIGLMIHTTNTERHSILFSRVKLNWNDSIREPRQMDKWTNGSELCWMNIESQYHVLYAIIILLIQLV